MIPLDQYRTVGIAPAQPGLTGILAVSNFPGSRISLSESHRIVARTNPDYPPDRAADAGADQIAEGWRVEWAALSGHGRSTDSIVLSIHRHASHIKSNFPSLAIFLIMEHHDKSFLAYHRNLANLALGNKFGPNLKPDWDAEWRSRFTHHRPSGR